MQNFKLYAIIAVVALVGYSFLGGKSSEQTADLGQVLDRVEYSLNEYQGFLEGNGVTEVGEQEFKEFALFATQILNSDPRFYDKTLGLTVMGDASFLGYADTNANGIQDEGEGKVFTVEIDEANNRLIASDESGNSAGTRFSGTGFIAGMFLGNLISRQRGAGIGRNSFANRSVTPRAGYNAPRSSRSGGLRAGK